MKWIKVEDARPKDGQEVLTHYLWDEGIHEIGILTYYEKGSVIGIKENKHIKNPEERLLDSLNSKNEILAEESYFYYYLGEALRKHANIITHWMPLPEPPS